jgi:hypothetical protein
VGPTVPPRLGDGHAVLRELQNLLIGAVLFIGLKGAGIMQI